MIGDDENNFRRKLLLTTRHVASPRKAFTNKSSTDIKLSNLRWYNQEDFLVDFLFYY